MSKFILYDIPSKDAKQAWSLNTWKTRLALNFKGIDYETRWVEYPDIAPTLKELGVPPRTVGNKEYTLPALQFPDGSVIMDSKKIITPLEQMYPEPSLHLDEEVVQKAEALVSPLFFDLNAVWMPKVPANLLRPRSEEYFRTDREKSIKRSLEEYGKLMGTEERWVEAKPAYEELGQLLRKNGGPYFLGKTPSYADFYIVSFLYMLKVSDQADFDKATSFDPVVRELYDACAKWLERRD